MASKEEVTQLKKTVQELRKGQLDILIRLENLEDRLGALEGGAGEGIVAAAKPKEPEPILTCVQCKEEYKESENAEGSCHYHSGNIRGAGWDFKYTCCNKSNRNLDSSRSLPGCAKGKHHSKHHTAYNYSEYFYYMVDQSKKARETWMELDVEDHVTERSEWAEVGLSEEGKVYILVGGVRNDFSGIATISSEELKQCEAPTFTVLEKSDPAGWSIKAEIHSTNSVANALTVSIKPASSKTALVKRLELVFEGDAPRPGKVECISGSTLSKPSSAYSVPEDTSDGPVLEPGEDYSKDRKNDYETETSNNCPLTLQQHGNTEVASNTSKNANGKWNNMFTATIKVTNKAPKQHDSIAVTDVTGEYMNKDGEWVKCDEVWVGKPGYFRNNIDWFSSNNFTLEGGSTGTIYVRAAIAFSDTPPSSSYDGRRTHASLPQPLHLRATFIDQGKRSASVRFEQGNPPLPIATRELREKNWARNKPLQFHLFADDVDKCKRSDAALYYDDYGVLCYRPAPCDNSSQYYYFSSSLTTAAAYKAKQAGEKEYELTDKKKESGGSSVSIFVMVDTDAAVAYALKVAITTPTSSATGYYLLPSDDPDKASLTVEPKEVVIKNDFTMNWNVSRASKNDRIEIYPRYGKSYKGYASNKEATATGSTKMKAPDVPGQYEVRYYPAWLKGNYTGHRHDICWGTTVFTVTPAN